MAYVELTQRALVSGRHFGEQSTIAQRRSALARRFGSCAGQVVHIVACDAQVSAPFELQLESNVPLGPPETGLHHVHLYFDSTTPDGPYDLVYGNTAQVTGLAPGVHTILASLRNPNHGDAGPGEIISVTVVGSTDGAVTQRSAPMDDMTMPMGDTTVSATPQPETTFGY